MKKIYNNLSTFFHVVLYTLLLPLGLCIVVIMAFGEDD